jgi:hypothetical protein
VCEKCKKPLPLSSYVLVHVEIGDKVADDFRFHVDCFKDSIKEDSRLFDRMTVITMMKDLDGDRHE